MIPSISCSAGTHSLLFRLSSSSSGKDGLLSKLTTVALLSSLLAVYAALFPFSPDIAGLSWERVDGLVFGGELGASMRFGGILLIDGFSFFGHLIFDGLA